MATTLLVLLLMQAVEIILSRMLSLEMFGYAILAGTVASVLYQLTGPMTQAYYPRFTELVTKGETSGLITIYHQAAQLITVLVARKHLCSYFLVKKSADIMDRKFSACAQCRTCNGAVGIVINEKNVKGARWTGLSHVPVRLIDGLQRTKPGTFRQVRECITPQFRI